MSCRDHARNTCVPSDTKPSTCAQDLYVAVSTQRSLPPSSPSLAGDHLRRRPRVLRSDYEGKFVVSGEMDKPGVPTGCRGRPAETRGMQRGLGRAITAAVLLFTVHVLKGEEGPVFGNSPCPFLQQLIRLFAVGQPVF